MKEYCCIIMTKRPQAFSTYIHRRQTLSSMRSKTILSVLTILVLIFFEACTDVPLSFSTTISDERITGYWKTGDDAAIQIRKNSDGSVSLINYIIRPENGELEPDGDPAPVYFTTITENRDTFYFFSVETPHKGGKCYANVRYYISEGKLITQGIRPEFLEKTHKADENGVIVFGSAAQLLAFVKENLKNPELYNARESASRL